MRWRSDHTDFKGTVTISLSPPVRDWCGVAERTLDELEQTTVLDDPVTVFGDYHLGFRKQRAKL